MCVLRKVDGNLRIVTEVLKSWGEWLTTVFRVINRADAFYESSH